MSIDGDAVVDAVVRFGGALDDWDWTALRQCLEPELDTDYSSFRGTPPRRLSVEEFITLRRSGLAGLVSQHLSLRHLVEIVDDTARCQCDFVIHRWPADAMDQRFFHTYGYYKFTLQRGPGGWTISGIIQVVTRSEGDQTLHGAFRDAPPGVHESERP